ncbi:hypothetical protein, partial [Pseudomonas sp. FFUP_PS_473]|uniref:hypothetical protein n=1 Tax=Pseudomonas sp. FFUP_PS_473 TaxID=2060418 RepID=UPI001C475D83
GNKISNPPWVKFQSAGWVNFPSAPTHFRGLQFSRMGDFGACEASLIHISRAQVNLSRAG